MSSDSSFKDLMERLAQDEGDAARRIFERFAQRLVGLARTRLPPALRDKMDAEDVMQSVFKSFFQRQAEGEFELRGWDSLWAILTVLTLRKCGHQARFFRALRRDVRREVALAPGAEREDAGWELISREPTPDEAAILAETVENLMRGLSARDRNVVTLRLHGHTVLEISVQTGFSERTVHRVLDHVRTLLQEGNDSAG